MLPSREGGIQTVRFADRGNEFSITLQEDGMKIHERNNWGAQ